MGILHQDGTIFLEKRAKNCYGDNLPDKYFKKVFVLKKNLRYNLKETDNSDFPVNDYTYFLVGVSDSSIAPHPAGRIQCTVSFKNVGT